MPELRCPVCKKFIAEVSGNHASLRLRCLNNQCKRWHWLDLKTGETTPAPQTKKPTQSNGGAEQS